MLDIKLEAKGFDLKDIIKEINLLEKLTTEQADIGIFESKSARNPEKDGKARKSNAEIGYAHEFGVPNRNLPRRSFLRKPLADGSLETELNNTPIELDRKLLSNVAEAYLRAVKEEIIAWGYGEWPDLRRSTWESKKNKEMLRETEQLYNSLDKRIVKK